MSTNFSHEIHQVFNQLKAIDRRRSRIIDSVGAHFGRDTVAKVLARQDLLPPLFHEASEIHDFFDEREPHVFIRSLSFRVESYEAATVHALRTEVSKYQKHIDEQILFGSRTAGQEAARTFLTNSVAVDKRSRLSLSESVQAIFQLTYNGLPGDKGYIVSTRPLSDVSVHYRQSPHIEAWKSCGVDLHFMGTIKSEWISGILDIFGPNIEYRRTRALENGDSFGLEEYQHRL